MKEVNLIKEEHGIKIGQKCPFIPANVSEDCIFLENGVPVGFYMKTLPEKAEKLATFADAEFRTNRVQKEEMSRSSALKKRGNEEGDKGVSQYSTIIGSVAAKPHMKRLYPTRSRLHLSESAAPFCKAMVLLAKESEKLIKEILPEQYEKQLEILSRAPEKWRFANLFTSSISNYNISAPYHIDAANLKDCVNVIITKRKDSVGGNLNIPDYGATIDQCDNSIVVYPAWRNMHGVTPIIPTAEGGYRNSLVFYPLVAFEKYNTETENG